MRRTRRRRRSSYYRPGQILELRKVEVPRIYTLSAQEGGKVVSPMHRPP
jgi:hypothetical protein